MSVRETYLLRVGLISLILFAVGMLFIVNASLFGEGILSDTLSHIGSTFVTIGIVTILYDYLVRKSFLASIHETMVRVIEHSLPESLRNIRRAGIVDVYENLHLDVFKARLRNELRDTNIRILKIWVPEMYVLEGPLVDAIIHRGCRVQILLLHPDSIEAIQKRTNCLGHITSERVAQEIEGNIEIIRSIRGKLPPECIDRLEFRQHNSFVSMSLMGYGETFLVGLYWSGRLATEGPQLKVTGVNHYMYQEINSHFEREWGRAANYFSDATVRPQLPVRIEEEL
jgi:hypothetical protein